MSECKHVLQVPQLNGRVRCEKCNVWFDSWTHATEIVALNSRIAELEQQLAQERVANEWIPVKERLPEPYKKVLDGLRTVSDIVICKDHLNTFWTDQTYLGYDGKPFWASLKCSCVGWKPIDKSDADSRN